MLTRVVRGSYLITVGLTFAIQGVIALQDPDYWEPVTRLDYAAVWTYSLALLLLAPALLILVREAQAGQTAITVAWIMSGAAVLTAVANAIEDAFDLKGMGVFYLLGIMPVLFGQIVLVVSLFKGDRKAFALVPLFTLLGWFGINAGGGVVIGVTWAAFGILILVGRSTQSTTASDTTSWPTPSPTGPA